MVDWHSFRMHFPKDAVLLRTAVAGRPAAGDADSCTSTASTGAPYTFAWRDDQADADLVPADGAEKEVARSRRPAKARRRALWQFHSRSQCMSCHSNQSEYALAFQPEQLNRPGPTGAISSSP